MSFPCNQCNLTFASSLEVNKHIKGDHVNMWAGTSDEEVSWMYEPVTSPTESRKQMESDPGSPEHKTSRKRLRVRNLGVYESCLTSYNARRIQKRMKVPPLDVSDRYAPNPL
jgi:hypothetical protein